MPGAHLPRPQRLALAIARDGARCFWCAHPFEHSLANASLDHLVPKLKGGPAWTENEVAACRTCNAKRGHLSPALWLTECIQRGRAPSRELVVQRLLLLHAAINERGGQRRARPYLDAQLRRLAAR